MLHTDGQSPSEFDEVKDMDLDHIPFSWKRQLLHLSGLAVISGILYAAIIYL